MHNTSAQHNLIFAANLSDCQQFNSGPSTTWTTRIPPLSRKRPVTDRTSLASPLPFLSLLPLPQTRTFVTCPSVECVIILSCCSTMPPEFTKFVQITVQDPEVDFRTVPTLSRALAPMGILNRLRVALKRITLKHLAQSGQVNDNVHLVGDWRWWRMGKYGDVIYK